MKSLRTCMYNQKLPKQLPLPALRSLNFLSMSDNNYENWLARRRLVSIAAAAVAAFYLHCLSIIVMSNSEGQAASTISGITTQQWTDPEIEAVLHHFISQKSELTDAGNFKKKTYTSAAAVIPGQTKTSSQVQTKWHGVSQNHYHFLN